MKPFWHSTTFWFAVLTIAVAVWDAYQPFIPKDQSPAWLAITGAVFGVLRIYTSKPIKGSPKDPTKKKK